MIKFLSEGFRCTINTISLDKWLLKFLLRWYCLRRDKLAFYISNIFKENVKKRDDTGQEHKKVEGVEDM